MSKISNKVPFLALLFASVSVKVDSVPICANGHTGCQAISLADLFDRVIQHSARMHRMSHDLHPEYEQYLIPSKNQIGSKKCHTSVIETPNGKENAQKLEGEELTVVIVKLLMAWRESLAQLYENMAQHEDYTIYSNSKVLEMSVVLHELLRGVQKVAEKMQLLGIINNFLNGSSLVSPNPLDSSEVFSHDLLHCFRRDSDKIQSYLKILKCRILPENGC